MIMLVTRVTSLGQFKRLRALLLRILDALLDVAHRFEVFVEFHPVASAQRSREPAHFLRHRVEDAAGLADVRQPFSRGAAVAEQPLEHDPRVVFHRQRRGRRPPGDRVRVLAAVAPVAGACAHIARFEGQLERGELRLLPELLRDHLID
jgi:hypothetical protein